MGGEYLPSYQREETEIARIELESTTSESSAFEPGGRTGKSITEWLMSTTSSSTANQTAATAR